MRDIITEMTIKITDKESIDKFAKKFNIPTATEHTEIRIEYSCDIDAWECGDESCEDYEFYYENDETFDIPEELEENFEEFIMSIYDKVFEDEKNATIRDDAERELWDAIEEDEEEPEDYISACFNDITTEVDGITAEASDIMYTPIPS